VRDFAEDQDLQVPGLRNNVPALIQVLKQEAASLGGRWDRVILAGISQGAAVSMHVLANLEVLVPEARNGLAAYMAFSSRTPFAAQSEGDVTKMRKFLSLRRDTDGDLADSDFFHNTPSMVQHCQNDTTVDLKNGKDTRDLLRAFGASVEWKEYETGGHWFNAPRGIDDAAEFLQRNVLQNSKAR
jgi:predicted esterase